MPRVLKATLILLAVVVAPRLAYPIFVMQALCQALFACSFNLLFGFGGLLSFGQAAFYGSAAYVAGYLVKSGIEPIAGILCGALVAAALGAAFGALAIRRRGIYLAMITLGLSEIIYFLANELPFTGGENGLQQIPRGNIFGAISLDNPWNMYYFVLAITATGYFVYVWIVRSPFGHVLVAIRENEIRARALGYNIEYHKILAFALSGMLAGVAGATNTLVFQFASLTDVHWLTGADPILMSLLGGLGTYSGPVIGALIVTAFQDFFAETGEWVTIITGALFITLIMFFRGGIVGELPRLVSWATHSTERLFRRFGPGSKDSLGGRYRRIADFIAVMCRKQAKS